MINIYPIIILLVFTYNCEGQILNPNKTDVKKFLKEIKAIEKKQTYSRPPNIELLTCNDDSTFYKKDTIIFYYRHLPYSCCNTITYSFQKKKLFQKIEILSCQEPPLGKSTTIVSKSRKFGRGEKIVGPLYQFKRKKGKTILIIKWINFKSKIFYEKFYVAELKITKAKHIDEKLYALVLVKIKG